MALSFKVAEGRQFDRSYNMFINDVMVGEDPTLISFNIVLHPGILYGR